MTSLTDIRVLSIKARGAGHIHRLLIHNILQRITAEDLIWFKSIVNVVHLSKNIAQNTMGTRGTLK